MGFSRDRVHVLLSLDTEHTNLDGASPRARVHKGGDYPQSWWRIGATAVCSTPRSAISPRHLDE